MRNISLKPAMNKLKELAVVAFDKLHPKAQQGIEWIEPKGRHAFFSIMGWAKTFNKNAPEVEFYPAALEVLETPPSPHGRAIAALIMGFFVLALLWACIGTVDVITTAQGKILPTTRTKVIQPMETGVVRVIYVEDGQSVEAGDVLIEIDSTISEAEKQRLHSDWLTAEMDVARLRALLTEEDPTGSYEPPEDASPSQILLQRSLLQRGLDAYRAKVGGLDRQIEQAQGNRRAVESTIVKLEKSIPLIEKKNDIRKYLSKKGYGSKLEMLSTQQSLIEAEQGLEEQKGRLMEVSASIASLDEQRKQAEAEFKQKTLTELVDAEQKVSSLKEQLAQAAERRRLQTLKAPVDGTVQQLAIHTEGGVVTPAQALLSIVPKGSKLEIEAMVSNRDIGFIHAGQAAQIKIDTFNFTRYGLVHGKVKSISQDAITRQRAPSLSTDGSLAGAQNETSEPTGQELVYAARVTFTQTQMDVDGRMVNLSPGMAVTVEIKTGQRRIISYLLSPIMKVKHESMRER